MQGRAIAILGLVVLGLGLLWLRQQEERDLLTRPEEPLFAGVGARDVGTIHIEHLARGHRVTLRRDTLGLWSVTDPVPYPARLPVVRKLLETIERTRGIPVDAPDLPALGLDPPRVVVEVVASAGGGAQRRVRVEVGAMDVDGVRLHARRVGGEADPDEARVMRVSRDLFTTLELTEQEYRDRRATDLDARKVISLRRSGRVVLKGEEGPREVDARLDALLDPVAGWKSHVPVEGTLDLGGIGLIVRAASDLQVTGFHDDAPQDLSLHGLDDPDLRIELEDERGRRAVLLFAQRGDPSVPADEAAWLAMREGYPYVWTVSGRDVALLATPRDLLYDTRLFSARRDDVVEVTLVADGRRVRVFRSGREWRVASSSAAAPPPQDPEAGHTADPGRVEDLLATLEFTEIVGFDEDAFLEPASGVTWSVSIHLADGRVLGGDLAPYVERPQRFRRFGDTLVGFVEPALVESIRTPPADLRSLWLVRRDELGVLEVEVASGERRRLFQRAADDAVWRVEDGSEAPGEFYPVLERLLFLQAERWVDEESAEEAPGSGRIEVVLRGPGGEDRLLFAPVGDDAGAPSHHRVRLGEVTAELPADLGLDLRALLH